MKFKLLVSMIVMMFFVAGAVSAYTVTGTVTGSGVGAIQGADVTAYNFTSGAVMDIATTGASGTYSLTLPDVTAAYIFNVTAAGYNTASKTSLVNEDETIDFILGPQPSVDITGIVYNAAGGVIVGAAVKAEYSGSTVDSTTTDGTGAYTLSVVDTLTYDVIASETGFISETQQITMSGNGVLDFSLTSAPIDGVVEGYVLDSTSGALPGVTVRLMLGGGTVDSDTADGTGFYSITAAGGTYDIEASLTDYNTGSENGVVVINGDTTDVNFTLASSTAGPTCGDGICNGDETCSSCPQDCGSCPPPPSSSCFPAGTKILMKDGSEKNIEDIKVGDKVIGFDGNNKVPVEVLELESPVRNHMYTLYFEDGSKLELTREHPLYTEDGWKSISPKETALENSQLEVDKLEVGDKVLNNERIYVELVSIDYTEKEVQTYNLKSVSEHNNFFANGFLAHNKGGGTTSHRAVAYDIELTEDTIVIQQLMRNDYVNFDYEEDSHRVTLTALTSARATIRVESTPITAVFAVLQRKGFNLDEDLTNDLFITLKSLSGNNAEFEFELVEPIVLPDLPLIPTPEPEVDVPEPVIERDPIRIIVEDIEYVQEDEEEQGIKGKIRNTLISIANSMRKVLYLKYIIYGAIILAVLIAAISIATKVKSNNKNVFKRAWESVVNFFLGGNEGDIFEKEVDKRDKLRARLKTLEKPIRLN